MSAPPSQTGIVNAAAARLGSTERITTIDDTGNLAKHARTLWDEVVRWAIADHPWNFAIARAELNAAMGVPAFGYERQFAQPADCYRVLPPRPEDRDDYWEGEVEGDYILSDAEAPLRVRYLSSARVNAVAGWPPHFVRAVTLELAAEMCEPLSGKQGTKDRLLAQAEEALRRAKRRDALESGNRDRNQITPRSGWLEAQGMPYAGRWSR